MTTGTHPQPALDLERRLANLERSERVPGPPEFVSAARIADPAVDDEADADPLGYWARRGRELD